MCTLISNFNETESCFLAGSHRDFKGTPGAQEVWFTLVCVKVYGNICGIHMCNVINFLALFLALELLTFRCLISLNE